MAAPVCSRVAAQMTGVTVEDNVMHGCFAEFNGVAQLEGCTVRGNRIGPHASGDYRTLTGGRIEGVGPTPWTSDN